MFSPWESFYTNISASHSGVTSVPEYNVLVHAVKGLGVKRLSNGRYSASVPLEVEAGILGGHGLLQSPFKVRKAFFFFFFFFVDFSIVKNKAALQDFPSINLAIL